MAPPKVRFLTKIYHPNIGVCDYMGNEVYTDYGVRQTGENLPGHLERWGWGYAER